MDRKQFIRQQISLGLPIHKHTDCWWVAEPLQYCKPVIFFQTLDPENNKPHLGHSLLGYSFLIKDESRANTNRFFMEIDRTRISEYSVNKLPSANARNHIRKGLKNVEVRKITDLEPLLGDLNEINNRTAVKTGVGHPASYYQRQYARWSREMMLLFGLEGRDWWGAFHGGKLIAYCYSYAIDDVYALDTTKGNPEFEKFHNNDALIFTVVEYALNVLKANRVINSDWVPENKSLNAFKEKFGFVMTSYPAFRYLNPLARLAQSLRSMMSMKRRP